MSDETARPQPNTTPETSGANAPAPPPAQTPSASDVLPQHWADGEEPTPHESTSHASASSSGRDHADSSAVGSSATVAPVEQDPAQGSWSNEPSSPNPAKAIGLQPFLAGWLRDHGHQVYQDVPCAQGGSVDIVTQMYAIDCQGELTSPVLVTASDYLRRCALHFPDQTLVIAGVTPPESYPDLVPLVERLATTGIEVWFVDRMEPFASIQPQLHQEAGAGTLSRVGGGRLSRRNPFAGCALALGIAAILTASFWLAYRILERYDTNTARAGTTRAAWERVHSAVAVWDLETAQESLAVLAQSRDRCTAEFARQLTNSLEEEGAEGFRSITPIKRALNQQQGCTLDIVEFEFSP